ncbi:hypothetical protein GDO81_015718 [Engystomops pustulosus]|uniref:Uncharacterized protein n=1 Tax=Engystomops pustulosus TaxID=76066 RepID=A0AAV7AMU1_ENGPU|nr:hypothetical protein GDO81_015718 [Engystomops pustulosus]
MNTINRCLCLPTRAVFSPKYHIGPIKVYAGRGKLKLLKILGGGNGKTPSFHPDHQNGKLQVPLSCPATPTATVTSK